MKTRPKVEAVAQELGSRIRKLRQSKQITLEAMSEQADLSPSFLSRLERGEANASISNLIGIAASLDISLQELFAEAETQAPPYTLFKANEHETGPSLTAHGYTYKLTTGSLPTQNLSAFQLSFPPGQKVPTKLLTHEGEEVLYILEGTVQFQIGDDSFLMTRGDCVHFNCSTPHMGYNVGDIEAHMLMVVTPAGSIKHG